MQNFIKNIEIENYKSIKKQNFDCERINLFIGRPNVGKSNLLEALSLLGKHSGDRFYSDYLNYEEIPNLFYDQNIESIIKIKTDKSLLLLKYFISSNDFAYILDFKNLKEPQELIKKVKDSAYFINQYIKDKDLGDKYTIFSFNLKGNIENASDLDAKSNIFSYDFKKNIDNKKLSINRLSSPFGENIFEIIVGYQKLRNDLTSYLNHYDLEIVYSFKDQTFHIQKKINGVVYETPYSLLADTLQRIIFYNAAIYSNSDSVLIFEEPEVNSFPPYIQELAENIVDSESNQFFISTHSPYLLNTIIEKNRKDIGVFIVEYRDHQTIVKKLTEDDISELLDYGTDIFLNIEDFFENGK